MTQLKAVELAAALVVSAPGVTTAVTVGSERYLGRYTLDVSDDLLAVPLAVTLESADVSDWVTVCTAVPMTAVGAQVLVAMGCKKLMRARYSVTGGSVTFSLRGTSDQLFCTPVDIAALSLPPASIAAVPLIDQTQGCLAATDEAVSYLGVNYDLPLTAWGNALRLHTANMAAYHVMKRRGFNPDNDPVIRLGYTDALAWLKGPAKTDPTIIDSSPAPVPGASGSGPFIISEPSRNWPR